MFPPRWKSIVEGEGWLFAAPGMFDPAGNQETKGALLIPLVTNGTRTQQVLGALSRIYRISMMERERERERGATTVPEDQIVPHIYSTGCTIKKLAHFWSLANSLVQRQTTVLTHVSQVQSGLSIFFFRTCCKLIGAAL